MKRLIPMVKVTIFEEDGGRGGLTIGFTHLSVVSAMTIIKVMMMMALTMTIMMSKERKY